MPSVATVHIKYAASLWFSSINVCHVERKSQEITDETILHGKKVITRTKKRPRYVLEKKENPLIYDSIFTD